MLTQNIIFLFEKEKEKTHNSIAKICEKIGITKQNYNRYKNGSEPTATIFYKIAKYFNIPMEQIIITNLKEQENNNEK